VTANLLRNGRLTMSHVHSSKLSERIRQIHIFADDCVIIGCLYES